MTSWTHSSFASGRTERRLKLTQTSDGMRLRAVPSDLMIVGVRTSDQWSTPSASGWRRYHSSSIFTTAAERRVMRSSHFHGADECPPLPFSVAFTMSWPFVA